MTRKNYINVSIPETLIDEIDELVKNKIKGYSSRAEFIKEAIRKNLNQIK